MVRRFLLCDSWQPFSELTVPFIVLFARMCFPEDAAAVSDRQSPNSRPSISPWKSPCDSKLSDSTLGGTFVRWEENAIPWWVSLAQLSVSSPIVKTECCKRKSSFSSLFQPQHSIAKRRRSEWNTMYLFWEKNGSFVHDSLYLQSHGKTFSQPVTSHPLWI